MPAYEPEGFEPPAAVARVQVTGLYGRAVSDVPMLIDTGSDVSVVPFAIADAVGAGAGATLLVASYDGVVKQVDLAELSIELAGLRFNGRYAVMDRSYGVLGRDVLNHVVTTLDGPGQRWSVG